MTDKETTLKHIKVFGCTAFVYTGEQRTKFHAKAQRTIFLGCSDSGIYTVERINDTMILNSVHVRFDEDSFPGLESSYSSSSGYFASHSSEPEVDTYAEQLHDQSEKMENNDIDIGDVPDMFDNYDETDGKQNESKNSALPPTSTSKQVPPPSEHCVEKRKPQSTLRGLLDSTVQIYSKYI